MSERPWEGRVAFITGAATGIGLGVAQAFADAGMKLALSYRNEEDRAAAELWFANKGYDRPLFLRLLFRELDRLGYPFDEPLRTCAYRMYHGDMVGVGRGEVLVSERP